MRAAVARLPQSGGTSVTAARCPHSRETAQRPPHSRAAHPSICTADMSWHFERRRTASRPVPNPWRFCGNDFFDYVFWPYAYDDFWPLCLRRRVLRHLWALRLRRRRRGVCCRSGRERSFSQHKHGRAPCRENQRQSTRAIHPGRPVQAGCKSCVRLAGAVHT
jgi:hypothetical protein